MGFYCLNFYRWFDAIDFLKTDGTHAYHSGKVRIITEKLRSVIGTMAIRHHFDEVICVVLNNAAEALTGKLREVSALSLKKVLNEHIPHRQKAHRTNL